MGSTLAGYFLSRIFWEDQNSDPKNQYCPEDIHKIEWRLFLSDFLTEVSNEQYGLADYELNWSTWTKKFANFLNEHRSKFPLLIDREFSKLRAPRGEAKAQVKQIIQNPVHTPKIRFTTIHGIKGETVDAALLVSAFDRKSDGGHWEQWIDDQSENGEHLRFSYVASSRPKHLLVWAILEKDNNDYQQLIQMGFAAYEKTCR